MFIRDEAFNRDKTVFIMAGLIFVIPSCSTIVLLFSLQNGFLDTHWISKWFRILSANEGYLFIYNIHCISIRIFQLYHCNLLGLVMILLYVNTL